LEDLEDLFSLRTEGERVAGAIESGQLEMVTPFRADPMLVVLRWLVVAVDGLD
jgi:hypothetical protein